VNLDTTIRTVIAQCRAEAKLTQEQTAGKSGLCPSTIAKYESGSRAPHTRTLFWLAPALGLKPSELVERIEALNPEVTEFFHPLPKKKSKKKKSKKKA